jgi:hypothetical protein
MLLSTRIAGVALALAACAAACAKRAQSVPAAPAPAAAAIKSAGQPQTIVHLPTPPHPAWTAAPDSEETRSLRAAQTSIDEDPKFEKLAAEKDLRRVLGDAIGAFTAQGEIESAAAPDPAAPLVVAARNYKSGASEARVKLTDTGLLPSARHAVSSHLVLVGNDVAGHEAGAFVRGYPAVLAHYDADQKSRATALIGNRYLVQITVDASPQPDAARQLLERLDWSSLAPKQGKPPPPR